VNYCSCKLPDASLNEDYTDTTTTAQGIAIVPNIKKSKRNIQRPKWWQTLRGIRDLHLFSYNRIRDLHLFKLLCLLELESDARK